jgi:cupin fold WbuC family metalloprotein
MINVNKLNDEVMYAADPIVQLSRLDIGELIERAGRNPRKRVRICTHKGIADNLHEMFIIHTRETYVRPHKHLGKSESFHVIEGAVDVVVFDDRGEITEVIAMGDYSSGKTFYYRIADPLYHTLLIRSEVIVFHEATNGPFERSDTLFAPWAPEDGAPSQKEFMERLTAKVASFFRNRKS